MASAKNLLPSKRRVGILIGFFLVLATLFSLFQFYYVPSNRDKVHEYGFMMLNRIKINIAERDNDLRKYYSNTVEKELVYTKDTIQAHLVKKNFPDRFIKSPVMNDCLHSTVVPGTNVDSADGFGFIKGQDDWLRLYTFHASTRGDSFALGLPARNFFEPAFAYRKEMFDSYVVISRCADQGIVLYRDPRMGVGDKVVGDTDLVKSIRHNTSQIIDLRIKGVDYKMFTYPFDMGAQSLVLCGLVKSTNYSSSLRKIPAGLVYPVLLLILALLVALPFVKPYLLSPHEKLNIRDLYLMGIALFGGLTLITLVVIQALILGAVAKKERRDLIQLSDQLQSSLLQEIAKASGQLDHFDSVLVEWKKSGQPLLAPPEDRLSLPAVQQISFLPGTGPYYLPVGSRDSGYYFMERAAWINANGDQTIKAQLDTGSGYQLINVRERNYFKLLKSQQGYLLPGAQKKPIVLDPIYSWTAGDFKINLSQESQINSPESALYAVLVARFSSLVATIFPAGYGYCLIDEEGNVLTHSDQSRNLRENFLDETGRPQILIENMASRQSNYINRIMLYGRPYALYISPVRELPFHVVIFHDKTYRIPINLRIAAFALVFILLFYLIAFFSAYLFRNVFRFTQRPSVFRPAIASRDRLLPSARRNKFYIAGLIYICFYVLIFLACVFSRGLRTDSFVTLIVSLFTPVNLIASLFLLERVMRKNYSLGNTVIFFRGWSFFFVFVIVSLMVIPFDDNGQRWQFAGFESFWLAIPLLLWFFTRRESVFKRYENISERRYLTMYSWFAISLIVCFTILPACIFTWYAHNYEIRQSVKKQQLRLSVSLAERREDLKQFFRNHDKNKLPASFFNQVQYHEGIYRIYSDSIYEVQDTINKPEDVTVFLDSQFKRAGLPQPHFKCLDESERFYLDLADDLSRNYNDPTSYPALGNVSSDSAWYWFSDAQDMYFYRKYPYASRWPADSAIVKGLMIRSVLPPRFELLSSPTYQLAIVLFVIGLLILLVNLVKRTIARVFLPGHILSPLQACRMGTSGVGGDSAMEKKESNLFIATEEEKNRSEWKKFDPATSMYYQLRRDSKLSDEELMDLVEQNEKIFESLWEKLSDKQKLLLLDMAQDGLINYRNTDEIRDLVRKKILVVSEDRMQLFSYAFGYYLRSQKSIDKKGLDDKFDQTGNWSSFRTPLIVIILSIAVFIFATQEDVWNKIIGLIGSLTAILTLLQRFIFTKGTSKE